MQYTTIHMDGFTYYIRNEVIRGGIDFTSGFDIKLKSDFIVGDDQTLLKCRYDLNTIIKTFLQSTTFSVYNSTR